MKRNRNACWGVVVSCLIPIAAGAQTSAPAPDKDALQMRLTLAERRADLLLNEVKATDGRLEERLDNLVAALRMVGDSKDSRTKVVRMKEQTIKDLAKLITFYQQRRAAIKEEMRRPTYNLTMDEKRKLVTAFDERIERRVNQILEINKSLPQHEDYDRYHVVGDSWWGGVTYVESEDYKQNQRLTTHTNQMRDKIIKGLNDSISRLQTQNRSLAQPPAGLSAAMSGVYAEEMQKNEELIKVRQQQLNEVLTEVPTATRPISGKEAQALDMAMRQAVSGIKTELTNLFRQYTELLSARSSYNTLRAAEATAK